MVGNFVSNMGLVTKGANQAALDTENIAQQKQQTATGALGLEELSRTSKDQAAQRTAVQKAGASLHDIAISKADAAKQAGDSEGFQKYASEAMQMPTMTAQTMSQLALSGTDPQEIESNVERIMGKGTMFDPGSLRVEKRADGHVILSATKGGQPLPPKDATEFYARQQKPVALSKDQTLVNPYSKEVIASNTQPEAGAAGGSTYMKTGPNAGQIVSRVAPRRTISTVTRTGATEPKDLPAFNAIRSSVLGFPGMAESDVGLDIQVPTEAGNVRMSLANQLYQTNRHLDPSTVANIAVKGKPKVNQKTGETAIEYQGKLYPYNSSQISSTPTTTVTESQGVTDEYPNPEENYSRGGKVNPKGLC